jgi:hypothetical protein
MLCNGTGYDAPGTELFGHPSGWAQGQNRFLARRKENQVAESLSCASPPLKFVPAKAATQSKHDWLTVLVPLQVL